MPPHLTIPLLITPFNDAVKSWLLHTVSRGLPLGHPEINPNSLLIAGTRCSQGGLGLPLNYHGITPLAYLTTQLSSADTLTDLYGSNDMADHGLIYLIEQLYIELTPESEEDFLIVEGFPAKQDLITALNQLKVLKNLHPNTSLVDVSQYKQLSQSYASTALSIDNVKIITERLHSVANRAQFLSQQQDGAMYPVMTPPTYYKWTFDPLQYNTQCISAYVFFPWNRTLWVTPPQTCIHSMPEH